MIAIRSADQVTLVSIPRDLYVPDTCAGGRHRISNAFAGCGDLPGLTNLTGELNDLTGLQIQHALAVDLAGFQDVVDALGGYEICSDYALRDVKSGLRLAAGCTTANGETTLQWLRSRHTEQKRNGLWEPVPGVTDLTRNERQRAFLVDLLHRQAQQTNPMEVVGLVKAAAPHLTIDETLTLSDLAAWVWEFRDADVETAEIPVSGTVTSLGAQVLVPTVDVEDLIQEAAS